MSNPFHLYKNKAVVLYVTMFEKGSRNQLFNMEVVAFNSLYLFNIIKRENSYE